MELALYLQDGDARHFAAPIFLYHSKPVADCECMHCVKK